MPAYLLSKHPDYDFSQLGEAAQYLEGIDQILVYSLPLVTKFRGINVREGLLLHGRFGWGECAPFWDYSPQESSIWLKSALEIANFGVLPPLKHSGAPIVRDFVPVNATIPVESPENNAVRTSALSCATAKVKVADPGVSLSEDAQRVRAVAEVLAERFGAQAHVRVDANAAWTLEQAQTGIELLQEAASCVGGLEYVEQPCASVQEMAQLRQSLAGEVLVAADESIRRADDPLQVVSAGGADLAVVKVAPLGGPSQLLQLAKQLGEVKPAGEVKLAGKMAIKLAEELGLEATVQPLEELGVEPTAKPAARPDKAVVSSTTTRASIPPGEFPLVVSSALDSSIGLAAATAVAATLPVLPYACGLNTGRLLAEDVIDNPLVAHTSGGLNVARALEIMTGSVKISGTAPQELADKWIKRLQAMLTCLYQSA